MEGVPSVSRYRWAAFSSVSWIACLTFTAAKWSRLAFPDPCSPSLLLPFHVVLVSIFFSCVSSSSYCYCCVFLFRLIVIIIIILHLRLCFHSIRLSPLFRLPLIPFPSSQLHIFYPSTFSSSSLSYSHLFLSHLFHYFSTFLVLQLLFFFHRSISPTPSTFLINLPHPTLFVFPFTSKPSLSSSSYPLLPLPSPYSFPLPAPPSPVYSKGDKVERIRGIQRYVLCK